MMTTLDALREDCRTVFGEASPGGPGQIFHWYMLSDPALDTPTWRYWSQAGAQTVPLLDKVPNGRFDVVPHLHALRQTHEGLPSGLSSMMNGLQSEAMSLIVSPLGLQDLLRHLQRFIPVQLDGGPEMLLALWDGSILATLIGQADDTTLHVPGPVFSHEQRLALLTPIKAWWYADREAHWHRIAGHGASQAPDLPHPLHLSQLQEDQLVEAGVPDQVLFHLRTNTPQLLQPEVSAGRWHRFVRSVLPSARQMGLTGMRDLVNFTTLCIIYRQRMQQDPAILQLLDQVRQSQISLDEAMALMPE